MKSQLTRQARIITMPTPDPTGPMEKIALFNADGSPFLNSDNANVADRFVLPNVTLVSEDNPDVNALQLGEDASGVLKGQHISTADQLGEGLAAELTINPGAAKGTDQAGQSLRLSSGISTGSNGSGPIVFMTSNGGVSGTSENVQSNAFYIWGSDLEKALTPASDGAQDIGYPALRIRKVYTQSGIVVTSPDGLTTKTIGIDNSGNIVAL